MESKKCQQVRGCLRIEDHLQSTRRLSSNKYIPIDELDVPPTGDQRVLLAHCVSTVLLCLLHPFAKGIRNWQRLFMVHFAHLCPRFLPSRSAVTTPYTLCNTMHFAVEMYLCYPGSVLLIAEQRVAQRHSRISFHPV